MSSNVLIALLVALLTSTGINVDSINKDTFSVDGYTISVKDENTTEESVVIDENVDNVEECSTYDEEIEYDETVDEEEPSLEEKYESNKEGINDEEDVWYDVPYCDEHEFTSTEYSDGDGYGIEHICNKCGYSYTEPITEEEFLNSLEE